jgi:hypothetical protein
MEQWQNDDQQGEKPEKTQRNEKHSTVTYSTMNHTSNRLGLNPRLQGDISALNRYISYQLISNS